MTERRPLWIGITGGIGSGKSIVCRFFRLLGIPVYSADDRAKWLMANQPELKSHLAAIFGKESYLEDGSVNSPFLAEKVFSDPENLKKINSIVHPAVAVDFKRWAENQNTPYVIKEAALLFESGAAKELDAVIHVSSPLKIRKSRVQMRDPHRSEDQINSIINQQMPDEEKSELADFVIKNNDNKLIIPQILQIHEVLCSGLK